MAHILNLAFICFLFTFINSTFPKDLHHKESYWGKGKGVISPINLFNVDDVFTKHERYARHIELNTESIMSHLFKQMKSGYQDVNKKQNAFLRKVAQSLQKKMKKPEKKRQKDKFKRMKKTTTSTTTEKQKHRHCSTEEDS